MANSETHVAAALLLSVFLGCSAGDGVGVGDAGLDASARVDGSDLGDAAQLDGATTDGAMLDSSSAMDSGPARDAASADASDTIDSGAAVDAGAPIVIDDTGVPAGAALYTLDGTEYGVREIGRALNAVATASGVDNVILYVHGRGCGGGGEPDKSLAGAMPDMASDYSAAPIMLYWPGSDAGCPGGFPSDRAQAAGPALAVVLGDLYRWEQAHPARRAALGMTLITHSLGSFVVQGAAVVSGVDRLPASLFDAVIINSAASPASGHASWLSRVHFGAATYVTVNHGDNILRLADFREPTPLGRDIGGVGLTADVRYVDFTANGVNHAYYLAGGQHGSAMRAFYQAVMNGQPFDFASPSGADGPVRRDGATVYTFNGG